MNTDWQGRENVLAREGTDVPCCFADMYQKSLLCSSCHWSLNLPPKSWHKYVCGLMLTNTGSWPRSLHCPWNCTVNKIEIENYCSTLNLKQLCSQRNCIIIGEIKIGFELKVTIPDINSEQFQVVTTSLLY